MGAPVLARPRRTLDPVEVPCEPVLRPPAKAPALVVTDPDGTVVDAIGRCAVCGHLVPYGSGWRLSQQGYYGSRLVCGPAQNHRPAKPVLAR